MLVEYIRDENKVPFGCVVALDANLIGVSICSPKDHFSKSRAKEIASGRALITPLHCVKIPNRKVNTPEGNMRDTLLSAVLKMENRAKKYFKSKEQ